MKIRSEYTCPLELVHDILKGKWKTIIVFHLRNGGKSLSELQRETAGITQKMLLEQLSEIVVDVQKDYFPGGRNELVNAKEAALKIKEFDELVRMRMVYIKEDFGEIDKREMMQIQSSLPK